MPYQHLRQRSIDPCCQLHPADLQQPVIVYARGAGGFAGAAEQAAIQVTLGDVAGWLTFQHLLNQIDAAARSIQFISEQLVSGAGGGAEAAMYAVAQDLIGFFAFRSGQKCGWERGLHQRSG